MAFQRCPSPCFSSLRCYFWVIGSMGTKVHCKSYSLVGYSMNNLNENANCGSWSKLYDNDHFLQRQTRDEYSEIDKEELKQAMLKHEVIFRDQVYELHRLYKIQKDFMDKLKRKELHKYQAPLKASHSSPYSSHNPSEGVQKLWRIPQNPLASSSCSRLPMSNFNDMQSTMNYSKERSMQINPGPTHNKCSLMDCESQESTSKKFTPKKIDLQLPADEYLASEETRQIEKEKATDVLGEEYHPLKRYCWIASENDASDRYLRCRGDASNSEKDTECKHEFADLNEPVQIEEKTTAALVNFIDPASCHRANQGKNFCSKPNSVFVGLSMEYLQNNWRGRDDRVYIDIQHLENRGSRQELDMHAHQSDFVVGSSSVSSWIKPKRIPCVKPSVSLRTSPILPIPSLGSEEGKCHFNANSRPSSSFESEISHQNGIFHKLQSDSSSAQNRGRSVGFDYNCCDNGIDSGDIVHNTSKNFRGSNCTDLNSVKDTDLNLALLSGSQVGMVPQLQFVTGNEAKNEDLPRGSPILRMKPTCNVGSSKGKEASKQIGLDFLHGYSQHSTCKMGTKKVPTTNSIQNFTSASCATDPAFQMFGVGDSPNTERILEFPIVNKLPVSKDQLSLSSLSNSLQCLSEAVEVQRTAIVQNFAKANSGERLSLSKLGVDNGLGNNYSDRGNYIDLNSCTKEEASPKASIRKIIEIDLEELVDHDTVGDVPIEEDSLRNQLAKGNQSSQTGKGTPQELVKTAAEAIVIISTSGNHDYFEDVSCPSVEASLRDHLHWFSEVITSVAGDPESKVCVDDDELSCGMDYFEFMTLKLTETKADEYCSNHLTPEFEEVTNASSLMTKHSRGKGRRGGVRKDFQRDILPSFASLSRHEVSEDLEMLEGLMRSMGQSWQTGLAKRNAARNGRSRGVGARGAPV